MTSARVLIIDDEPDIRELLSITLSRMGLDCDTAADVSQGKSLLSNNTYQLCLTDMRLPDGNGLEIVQYIQINHPELPVTVITAHGNMDTAVDSMKAGAFDFINKPIELSTLRKLIESAISSNTIKTDDKSINIIGDSPRVIELKKRIKKLARSQAPVYINGESGSGKELVARAIHSLGSRGDKPFVPVNCGAIPTELVESEFFGFKKGSFTGATHDSEGLFQAANGGTLFLDEVADLPLSMQVKLLRAIQEKAIRAVGSQSETQIDVRILSATHKDLESLVNTGEFRQDLFYRLNVIQLDVPALRDREHDIPTLIEHILKRFDAEFEGDTTAISAEALNLLLSYNFPGNVRELENILERAYTLCENDTITAADLQLKESSSGAGKIKQKIGHFKKCATYPSIDEYLAEIEKEILMDALESVRWNKTLAAKTLGISFRSFRYRLSKLGLGEEEE
ncbi:MAG: two-component system response regulator PilR (NtrC family) [Flavobacteriales bacterium]|jgi:two-component system response regulator PilR (NtrC family)